MASQTCKNTIILAAMLSIFHPVMAALSESEELALRCEAGKYTEGQNAAITCHFNETITNNFNHIYVTLFPSIKRGSEKQSTHQSSIEEDNEGNGRNVLVCIKMRRKEIKCTGDNSYHFSKMDENTFSFIISEVKALHAGHYACQLVPPDKVPQKKCYLQVNGIPPEEKEPGPVTDSGIPPEEKEPGPVTDSDKHTPVIIGVAFGAIVVIVLAALAVFTFVFKRLLNGGATTENNVETGSLLRSPSHTPERRVDKFTAPRESDTDMKDVDSQPQKGMQDIHLANGSMSQKQEAPAFAEILHQLEEQNRARHREMLQQLKEPSQKRLEQGRSEKETSAEMLHQLEVENQANRWAMLQQLKEPSQKRLQQEKDEKETSAPVRRTVLPDPRTHRTPVAATKGRNRGRMNPATPTAIVSFGSRAHESMTVP